jgi:MerR family transcriptional regulator, thiopeptide resistance regulator
VRGGWTVGQVAQAAGLTVRALHHWEAVGLLAPSRRTPSGYRLYDGEDVARLQRVLAYRALGFGLDDVRALLDDDVDVAEELRRQSERLRDRAAQLLHMAEAIDRQTEARRMGIELGPHEMLEVFGPEGSEGHPAQHAEEVEQRWGDTEAYAQSQQRARGYGKDDWLRMQAEQAELESRLVQAFTSGAAPDGDEATALAEEHRRGIERWFYDCPCAMHRGLGQMYVEDARLAAHYDDRAPGLAGWLRAAIEANAARHGA